jgi:hypothetical protein
MPQHSLSECSTWNPVTFSVTSVHYIHAYKGKPLTIMSKSVPVTGRYTTPTPARVLRQQG